MKVRPIDGNAVIQAIEDFYCRGCNSYNGVRCRACNFDDAMSVIDDAPTLDYAPVRHGEWMPWYKEDKNHKTGFSRGLRQLGWWCSACHGRSGMRTNFCPNCGALMSGGSANGL